jgi:ATP adenylyltransferase/5',5'''-P-1,P-4-tetraphosphate phosphorylase II
MYNGYKRIIQQKVYSINAAAYNIIATEEFIMIVARSKEKAFDEIAINSVGKIILLT